MEPTEVKKATSLKKPVATSLRVKPETRKRLLVELSKVNKKTFGRKVRTDQLLNLLLTLLEPKHIQKLQDESLSNTDRIEMKYREHVKQFGAISKDEYLGLLLGPERAKTDSKNAVISEGKSAS